MLEDCPNYPLETNQEPKKGNVKFGYELEKTLFHTFAIKERISNSKK